MYRLKVNVDGGTPLYYHNHDLVILVWYNLYDKGWSCQHLCVCDLVSDTDSERVWPRDSGYCSVSKWCQCSLCKLLANGHTPRNIKSSHCTYRCKNLEVQNPLLSNLERKSLWLQPGSLAKFRATGEFLQVPWFYLQPCGSCNHGAPPNIYVFVGLFLLFRVKLEGHLVALRECPPGN